MKRATTSQRRTAVFITTAELKRKICINGLILGDIWQFGERKNLQNSAKYSVIRHGARHEKGNSKMKIPIEKVIVGLVSGIMLIMLAIIGFLAQESFDTVKETFVSIKTLEKDIVDIRLKLTELEAKRISRAEIEHIIKDYHDNHPCIRRKE
jgi:hypothetical protein